jgi:hypothetical protein
MATTRIVSATVASGATVSSVIMASEFNRFGLLVPSDFDGTTISFQVSANGNNPDATSFSTLCATASTGISLVVAASQAYDLSDTLRAWPAWRIITPAQTGAAVLTVVMKSE